jgi:hypothetical protein
MAPQPGSTSNTASEPTFNFGAVGCGSEANGAFLPGTLLDRHSDPRITLDQLILPEDMVRVSNVRPQSRVKRGDDVNSGELQQGLWGDQREMWSRKQSQEVSRLRVSILWHVSLGDCWRFHLEPEASGVELQANLGLALRWKDLLEKNYPEAIVRWLHDRGAILLNPSKMKVPSSFDGNDVPLD